MGAAWASEEEEDPGSSDGIRLDAFGFLSNNVFMLKHDEAKSLPSSGGRKLFAWNSAVKQ